MSFEYEDEEDKLKEMALISEIHDYIDSRIEEDEDGEPPDNDTVLEGMGFSDDKIDLVDKAYESYWKRGWLPKLQAIN